jgi:hypothetical protein
MKLIRDSGAEVTHRCPRATAGDFMRRGGKDPVQPPPESPRCCPAAHRSCPAPRRYPSVTAHARSQALPVGRCPPDAALISEPALTSSPFRAEAIAHAALASSHPRSRPRHPSRAHAGVNEERTRD